ncbi:hypothetical protein PROFUN_12129 [Planoprotostelium fungivorum]|uniref:Uncharacterized protein n=1 Tax=Planoprotostelium fungivorum TaxID=1890364 RepID=A0A2P6N898_9EUKA|nr:hypothetical protein PROFUN_12129 [Planoprotostelium fungivorum]
MITVDKYLKIIGITLITEERMMPSLQKHMSSFLPHVDLLEYHDQPTIRDPPIATQPNDSGVQFLSLFQARFLSQDLLTNHKGDDMGNLKNYRHIMLLDTSLVLDKGGQPGVRVMATRYYRVKAIVGKILEFHHLGPEGFHALWIDLNPLTTTMSSDISSRLLYQLACPKLAHEHKALDQQRAYCINNKTFITRYLSGYGITNKRCEHGMQGCRVLKGVCDGCYVWTGCLYMIPILHVSPCEMPVDPQCVGEFLQIKSQIDGKTVDSEGRENPGVKTNQSNIHLILSSLWKRSIKPIHYLVLEHLQSWTVRPPTINWLENYLSIFFLLDVVVLTNLFQSNGTIPQLASLIRGRSVAHITDVTPGAEFTRHSEEHIRELSDLSIIELNQRLMAAGVYKFG